jgi:polar amino acid transport system permease protein
MEAARALGLSYLGAMRFVVLPQAVKRMLPPLAGQFISLIKDSSLLSVISISELSFTGKNLQASEFRSFETWLLVAALYLVLTGSLSAGVHALERRLEG